MKTKAFLKYLARGCNNHTQFLDHLKSSSIWQLMKGKSRDLQKLLKYLSQIMVSVLKGGIGDYCGCGGCTLSGFCDGCAGRGRRAAVFPIAFVIYSNNLLFEALSSTTSIPSL